MWIRILVLEHVLSRGTGPAELILSWISATPQPMSQMFALDTLSNLCVRADDNLGPGAVVRAEPDSAAEAPISCLVRSTSTRGRLLTLLVWKWEPYTFCGQTSAVGRI